MTQRPLPLAEALLDVERVVQALARHDVQYLFVGGVAGLLHGSPLTTEDVDITPSTEPANLDRLAAALRDLGAQWRVEGADVGFPPPRPLVGADLAGKLSASFVTTAGLIDVVLVHSDGARWDRLRPGALRLELYGQAVLVAHLRDVIAAKEAASRPKDERALPLLRELLRRTTGEH